MHVASPTDYLKRMIRDMPDEGMKSRGTRAQKRVNYQDALEFIGEVRGGISWERFCIKVVRNFDAFIDLLGDAPGAKSFLAQSSIERSYVVDNLNKILDKVYFNPENDYYLTLGLPHNVTADQIHDRWKSLMMLYHPDRHGSGGSNWVKCTSKINEVYSVLKDTGKRMEYDRKFIRKKTVSTQPSVGMKKKSPVRQASQMRRHYVIPTGPRKLISKIILPLLILICIIILFVLFLENRNAVFIAQ